MTTTQELIARLRDYEYEGCGVSVTQDAADALEALQAENDRQTKAKDAAINLWNEAGKGLQVAESERNAALARLAAIEAQEPVAHVVSLLGGKIITTIGDTFDLEHGANLYAAAGASPVTNQLLQQCLDAMLGVVHGEAVFGKPVKEAIGALRAAISGASTQPLPAGECFADGTVCGQCGCADKIIAQPVQPSQARELSDEEIEPAVRAWFDEKVQAGRYPFAKRMRAAIAAVNAKGDRK